MGRFDDKVIVITGAAGGIGKAVAKKVTSEGAKVALVDLNLDAVQNVISELGLDDSRAIALQADVSQEDQVKAYVDVTVDKFGKIDGFLNNAGVEGKTANVEEYPTDVFEFVFNVNVKGAYFGLKYMVPVMKKQGYGSIVNTASLAGLMGSPGMIAYNSSKHAVIGMTRVVATEVAKLGIRVNAVAPGVINTRMMRQIEENTAPGAAEAAQKAYNNAVPMGRYGEPEEVANVTSFLLSDEASYVTQSIYTVDGGLIMQ
ncbi:NAD(P)-dependent dehydrogenase (short-subunit alcohol dehydrogenase family) [Bacillus oleivorans]|uniref:NAD(P)-dependent dehydrogenase (Short-subunit alcohol dehydrogenase family) n=1 Tax=Bacillus oleivorans TaxID=1448271 RepID=A0A285D3R8_9BACI|nr:SDR family NAD(P)-dependent oxidoreductase [Bacillus oleivorans]SNX74467.1 NAD(P)-dependent dehydrogenase (short-subunit alcohol dehydrogenase family) [Bacillus oleivorans]